MPDLRFRKSGVLKEIPKGTVLVDGILQAFTSFELRLVGGFNLNRFARPRVTSRGSFTVSDGESTEADQANFFFLGQRARDGIENTIDGFGRVRLGKAGAICDGGNEIVLVQGEPPFMFESKKIRKCFIKKS